MDSVKIIWKRWLSLALAVMLILGNLPVGVRAADISAEENPWDGTSAVFVGDSITAGSGTEKVYYEYLEESLGFDAVTAMGVAGSCISAASDYGQSNQPLISWYQSIPSADLILIFMGTNDYGHETPLGSVEDIGDGSFYGALNVIVPALLTKHSSSKIVFVTPLHRYGFGTSKILGTPFTSDSEANGVGATLGDYVEALKTVCEKYDVPMIDLYTECTLDPADAAVRAEYMPDGLHPNAAGHEVIAGIMESHIRSFAPAEKVPEIETELIYGNKFASGYDQQNRASSRLNQYLKAGTVITLKDTATFQWACAKTSGESSSDNLGYFPDSGWSDQETAVVEADGWVGFTFKYRDETEVFDLTKPLSDYILVKEPQVHNVDTNRLFNTIEISRGQLDPDTDGAILESDIYGYVVNYPLKKGHTLSISDGNYVFSVRRLVEGDYSTMLKQATTADFTATEDMTVGMLIRKPDKSALTAEELASVVIYDSQYGMIGVEGFAHRFTVEAETINGGTATTRANIFLPTSYSQDGTPTRLIVMTNGHSAYLTDSVWNGNTADNVGVIRSYLDAGFAVYVVNNTADHTAKTPDLGCPQLVSSYRKAYEYIQENFNVEKKLSIHSRSFGTFAAMRLMREMPELIKCAVMTGPRVSIKKEWPGLNKAHIATRFGFADTTGATYEADKLVGYDPYTDINGDSYALPPTYWVMCQGDATAEPQTLINKLIDHGNDVQTITHTDTTHTGVCTLNTEEMFADALEYLLAHQEAKDEEDKEKESLRGKTISILGASISTFAGTSNGAAADTTNSTIRSNVKYYPNTTIPEVTLNDTWWMQVAKDLGLRLLVNNAWSGSAILLERAGTVGAYVDRCVQLHDDTGDNAGEEPDIICIQMGFNDFSYGKDTLGDSAIDYNALITADGYAEPATTMEATAIMLDKIVKRYPHAEIYMFNHFKRVGQNASDTALMEALNASIADVCAKFGVTVVDLYTALTDADHIGDGKLHPNRLGMDVISEAVKTAILSNHRTEAVCSVSLELDGVTADYISQKTVVRGDAFAVNLTAPAGDELQVTVTMGGEDITSDVYANGVVSIEAVTDDVVIRAKAIHRSADYRWEFNGTDLACTEGDNALTKNAGTTTDGVFSKTRYALEKAVVLSHDQPWSVQWQSEGTWKNTSGSGGRMFTSDDVNAHYNARYIFKSSSNGLIAMGEKTTTGSHNYGIALGDHGIDATLPHVYRLENRVADDGSNMVWLYVDGEEIGPMTGYYVGTTDKKTTSDWLSGKDFVFPYMGTDTHGFTNCSIGYIQVWEGGHTHTYQNGICTGCGATAQDTLTHAVPESQGVANAIARAYALTDVSWTPLANVPGVQSADGVYQVITFEGGKTYKGIPYSGVTANDCYVGLNVSLESFLTALKNENSVLYTENLNSTNSKAATYFGTVCSKFAQYVLNIPGSYNTANVPNIPGMETVAMPGLYTVDQIKLGDVVVDTGYHTAVCTDILYDSEGNVAYVEISEAISPLCRRLLWSAEEFYEEFANYRLCRYQYIDAVPAADSATVSDDGALMPRFGDKYNYKVSSTASTVDVLKSGYSKAVILRDGTVIDETTLNGAASFTFDRSVPGNLEMYLEKSDGTRSNSVYACVVKSSVEVTDSSKFAAGKLTVTIDGSSGTPLYVQVGSAHAIFCSVEGKQGTVELTFSPSKISTQQVRVAYQNEYGIYLSPWVSFTADTNPSDDPLLSQGEYWDGKSLSPSSASPAVISGKEGYWSYTMVPVEAGVTYYSEGANRMWFLDANGDPISTYNAYKDSAVPFQFTVPKNAAYVSLSYSPDLVEKGTETLTAVTTTEPMSMRYDDHYDVTGKTVEILDAGTSVVTVESNYLVASGIGTARVRIDGTVYEITVDKAKLNLVMVIGQSNSGNHFPNATSAVTCPIGTAYYWNYGATEPEDYTQPSMGFHAPLLAELYAQSAAAGDPVKNVLIWAEGYTSKNGKSITAWAVENGGSISTEGTDGAAQMMRDCLDYYEQHSDQYEIVNKVVFCNHGTTDYSMDPQRYTRLFTAMWERLKAEGMEYLAFLRVRGAHALYTPENADVYYNPISSAQFEMVRSREDMFMATTLAEAWTGPASTTHSIDVRNYITVMQTYGQSAAYSDSYGNKASFADGILTTTMKELYGSNNKVHYGIFGYGLIGADAAYNMYASLNGSRAPTVTQTDSSGLKSAEHIAAMGSTQTLNIEGLTYQLSFYPTCGSPKGTMRIEVTAEGEDITEKVLSSEASTFGTVDTDALREYVHPEITVYYTYAGNTESVTYALVFDHPCNSGHTYEAVVTAPTCTEKGFTTHTCTECGDSYVDSYVDATGEHVYTEGLCICGKKDPYYGKKAVICFSFDDGRATDGLVYDIFMSKGLVCDFALITNQAYQSRKQVYLEYAQNGFGILSHSKTHQSMSSEDCSEEFLLDEMKGSLDLLQEAGFSDVGGWVTPYSTLHKSHLDMLRRYYDYGYTVYMGAYTGDRAPYNTLDDDVYSLHRVSMESTSLENLLKAIDETVAGKGFLNLYAHSAEGDLTQSELTALLDYVQAYIDSGKCIVTTTSDGVSYYYSQGCQHAFEDKITESTCTVRGFTVHTCKLCGVSYTDSFTDTIDHSYTPAVTAPTCIEKGFTTYTCTECGDSYVDSYVDAKGHKEETIPAVAATCTATGLTEGKKCSVCGEILVAQTVTEKLGHKEETIPAVAATCTAMGLTEGKKCSVCGEILVAQTVTEKLGHKEITDPAVDATCTASGLTEGKHCEVCGTTLVAQTVVPALGHTKVSIPAVAPTCTEAGMTGGETCGVCGIVTKEQTAVPATGHLWSDGTCGSCGKVCDHDYSAENGGCTVCGDKCAHAYETVVTKPTCTSQGYTAYTCSICGNAYNGDYVEALGHDWAAATCTAPKTCSVCGITEGQPNGHNHETVVTAPTCTEKGYTTHTCHCGDTFKDSYTNALGHTDGAPVEENRVESTCTTAGSYETVVDCAVCGAELSREKQEIPAKGHAHKAVVTEPTCTEQGYTTHTCSACGDSFKDSFTPAKGHRMGQWKVTVEATCTENGKRERVCENCSHAEEEAIPATGHDHKTAVTEPTCTEQGYTTYICHCGDSFKDSYIPALTHSMGDWVIKDATCTKNGSKTRTCIRCDYSETEVIPATGHSHSYAVTAAPTETAEGSLTGTCHCGDTVTKKLPKLSEADYTYSVIKEPTVEAAGSAKYVWNTTEFGEFAFEVTLPKLPSPILLGDVNEDGKISILDLMRLANHFAKNAEINEANADVNADGKISILDLMRLANYFAGKAQLGA